MKNKNNIVFLILQKITLNKILLGSLITTIVGYLYFSYFDIGPFPLPNYTILLSFLIVVIMIFFQIKDLIKINIFPIIIFYLLIISYLFSTLMNMDNYDIIKMFLYLLKRILIPSMLYISLMIFLSLKSSNIKIIKNLLLLFVGISALVGVMQWIGVDLFWELRKMIFFNQSDEVYLHILNKGRACGLAYYYITFSYHLVAIFPLILISFFNSKKLKKKVCLVLYFIVIILAISASATRSAFIGLLIGIIYLFLKVEKKYFILLIACLLFLSCFIFIMFPGLFRIFDFSTMDRVPLLLIGFLVLITHPFGISNWEHYFNIVQKNFLNIIGYERISIILNKTPHNSFINTGLIYGFIGFILSLFFFVYYWKRLTKIESNNWGLSIGYKSFLLAYFIHISMHNAGLFYGDVFIWFIIAIMEYEIRKNSYKIDNL